LRRQACALEKIVALVAASPALCDGTSKPPAARLPGSPPQQLRGSRRWPSSFYCAQVETRRKSQRWGRLSQPARRSRAAAVLQATRPRQGLALRPAIRLLLGPRPAFLRRSRFSPLQRPHRHQPVHHHHLPLLDPQVRLQASFGAPCLALADRGSDRNGLYRRAQPVASDFPCNNQETRTSRRIGTYAPSGQTVDNGKLEPNATEGQNTIDYDQQFKCSREALWC